MNPEIECEELSLRSNGQIGERRKKKIRKEIERNNLNILINVNTVVLKLAI